MKRRKSNTRTSDCAVSGARFALLFVCVSTCGCLSTARYDIVLDSVERPADATARYGEPKISRLGEEGVFRYAFEDGLIHSVWVPEPYQISFRLRNKTDFSIVIDWNEASFVDHEGNSHSVYHRGVKYLTIDHPQKPTVVVQRQYLDEFIAPSDKVWWTGNGWSRSSLLPRQASYEKLKAAAENCVGKTMRVLLPLRIEGVVNEYLFAFKIVGYRLE